MTMTWEKLPEVRIFINDWIIPLEKSERTISGKSCSGIVSGLMNLFVIAGCTMIEPVRPSTKGRLVCPVHNRVVVAVADTAVAVWLYP